MRVLRRPMHSKLSNKSLHFHAEEDAGGTARRQDTRDIMASLITYGEMAENRISNQDRSKKKEKRRERGRERLLPRDYPALFHRQGLTQSVRTLPYIAKAAEARAGGLLGQGRSRSSDASQKARYPDEQNGPIAV